MVILHREGISRYLNLWEVPNFWPRTQADTQPFEAAWVRQRWSHSQPIPTQPSGWKRYYIIHNKPRDGSQTWHLKISYKWKFWNNVFSVATFDYGRVIDVLLWDCLYLAKFMTKNTKNMIASQSSPLPLNPCPPKTRSLQRMEYFYISCWLHNSFNNPVEYPHYSWFPRFC